ncbi:class I SAM-dependent RNA methyltransferase [Mycoplasmopsis synoviae]|uniref:class I SAM-dependent RNA methyltransferase n=1 Tax=Mycoplasmopsis synoviae TaxID=2109 RepID=UPI003563DCB2
MEKNLYTLSFENRLMVEQLIEVTCQSISYEGYGQVQLYSKVLIASNFFPSEKAIVRIEKIFSKYVFAKVIEIKVKSKYRNETQLDSNSAQLVNLNYDQQIKFKKSYLNFLFLRNFQLTQDVFQDFLTSAKQFNYRNKITYWMNKDFDNRWNFCESIQNTNKFQKEKNSFLASKAIVDFKNSFLKFINSNSGFFDKLKPTKIMINSSRDSQIFVILICDNLVKRDLWKFDFKKLFPSLTNLIINYNNTFFEVYKGKTFVQRIGVNKFNVLNDSFFQVNGPVAKYLFDDLAELISKANSKSLIDFYCGVGAITIYLATKFPELDFYGYEKNRFAIKIANENVLINKLNPEKIKFLKFDLDKKLNDKVFQDSVIFDPPRAGLSQNLKLLVLNSENVKNIFYISCNPRTLVRDVKEITEKSNFKIKFIKGYDMFPQTHHIETLVWLSREN